MSRQRGPLRNPAAHAGGGAVPEQLGGHRFREPLRRHDLHAEPLAALLHLHRPCLHVERPCLDQGLAQRLHIFWTHVVHVGGEQHHAPGFRRHLGDQNAQRVRIVFGIALTGAPPTADHAPTVRRRACRQYPEQRRTCWRGCFAFHGPRGPNLESLE